jgi:hypothetical protein
VSIAADDHGEDGIMGVHATERGAEPNRDERAKLVDAIWHFASRLDDDADRRLLRDLLIRERYRGELDAWRGRRVKFQRVYLAVTLRPVRSAFWSARSGRRRAVLLRDARPGRAQRHGASGRADPRRSSASVRNGCSSSRVGSGAGGMAAGCARGLMREMCCRAMSRPGVPSADAMSSSPSIRDAGRTAVGSAFPADMR